MPASVEKTADNSMAPVLVVAPHLIYPTRDGADIAIDRRWGELSRYVSGVDIVAAQSIVCYRNGSVAQTIPFANAPRSKSAAALRTIFHRSVYTKEKFVTDAYVHAAKSYLGNPAYQAIIFSYLATVPLSSFVENADVKKYVLTHNDDVAIYRNMRKFSGNIVQKLVAILSEQWTRRYGRKTKSELRFIHVSEEDADGWTAAVGNHDYLLGKVGCDLPELKSEDKPPMSGRAPRIIFVGSLGVKMNLDAIQHFAEDFLPAIRQKMGVVDVRIVGSNPSLAVKKLCEQHEFALFANVSSDELAAHFAWTDFSMLPFPYSTGTKLKLLDSVARGVPIMATGSIGDFQGINRETACLVSDSPAEWADHIEHWQKTGVNDNISIALIAVAREWTWQAMAEQFYRSELRI